MTKTTKAVEAAQFLKLEAKVLAAREGFRRWKKSERFTDRSAFRTAMDLVCVEADKLVCVSSTPPRELEAKVLAAREAFRRWKKSDRHTDLETFREATDRVCVEADKLIDGAAARTAKKAA